MSTPNSSLPVQLINYTGLDISNVVLKHRYDKDHFDEMKWTMLKDGDTATGLQAKFWTGAFRTGKDYWQILFEYNGATFTCKDNFYCFLTKKDAAKANGVVTITLTLSEMLVKPPVSKSDHVTITQSGFPMANKRDGFYNIAHMVNTPKAICWALSKGANGLEADLNFDEDGNPTVYEHGGLVSDCTCNLLPSDNHVCSVVSKDDKTPAAELLRCIACQPNVALHVVDTKMNDDVDQRAAGANVIKLLENELFGAGYQGNVIVGVGATKYIDYIKAAVKQASGSRYKARISFTFDGEFDDYEKVFNALSNLNSVHKAYGTGITACSPSTYYPAILRGCVEETRAFHGLTYIWTLDSTSSMKKYLQHGVRGIMTNRPGDLRDLLDNDGIELAKPATLIPPATTQASL
ncbi:MAG: hypothetical protein AB8B99_23705 [Phormidesmis sp.]